MRAMVSSSPCALQVANAMYVTKGSEMNQMACGGGTEGDAVLSRVTVHASESQHPTPTSAAAVRHRQHQGRVASNRSLGRCSKTAQRKVDAFKTGGRAMDRRSRYDASSGYAVKGGTRHHFCLHAFSPTSKLSC